MVPDHALSLLSYTQMGQTAGFAPTTSESLVTIVQRPAMRARWVQDQIPALYS